MEQDILQWLDRIDEKIEKILIQTTRTNGRVDALEKNCAEHDADLNMFKSERNQNIGRNKVIWVIVSAVGTITLLVIGYFIKKL